MTSRFQDKFARADGEIGANYTVPCGGVIISDQAVIPINAEEVMSGVSPLFPAGVTSWKTQVFYSAEAMDGPDYVVRGTWAHDGETPSELDPTSVVTPSSFTLLARMSKDPLLYDLGTDESPDCYDQGYGARVTCPLDGSAPTLKLVKFMPARRLPGLDRPSSTEVDGMVVLASVVLSPDDLNLDPTFDSGSYSSAEILPYRGFWQDMRLRIRRADDQVILDVYLNDRNLNQPKLTYTDRVDPLWGGAGLPGFEFLSGVLGSQPAGVSPFDLAGLSLLRCGIFSCETILDVRPPVTVSPGSFYTYNRIVNRVITLVEKDGDGHYNATGSTATKFETYLRFVLEAEAAIIRHEGYWEWLRRSQQIFLTGGQTDYELPEDLGELEIVRPGNWNSVPLTYMEPWTFRQRVSSTSGAAGRPVCYTHSVWGPNSRPVISLYPTPGEIPTTPVNSSPFIWVDYFARQLFPDEPDVQIPFIPQQHIDVLVYGAAAHASLLDTDDANAQRLADAYAAKLKSLSRANNRKHSQELIARSAADVKRPDLRTQIPLLRATQLDHLLI